MDPVAHGAEGMPLTCDLVESAENEPPHRCVRDGARRPEYRDIAQWLGVDAKHPFRPDDFDPATVKFANPKMRLKRMLEM